MSAQDSSTSAEPPSQPSPINAPSPAGRLCPSAVEALLHAAAAQELPLVPPELIARTILRIRAASRESSESGVNLALR